MSDFEDKLIADKYRVGELIREGEAGDLYHGRHEVMDKAVTLKLLPLALGVDARWTKRFIDEARAASAVTHSNLLNINDFGTDAKNVSYAVYDSVDGATLADDRSMKSQATSVELARQIANAVAAAHEKQLVHGNLSPRNVFINTEDETQTAKVYGLGGDALNVGRKADPRYHGPEQLGDYPVVGERSDVYALGVMLYEMLSGEAPFEGNTAADVLAKQNEPPPPLSAFREDLNREIEPIILSAIAADPEHRYQTMSAFAEDLDILASRVGGSTKAAAATADSPKRSVWQTAFVVFAGIMLLAAAMIYVTYTRGTDPTTELQADADALPVQPLGPATGSQEDGLMRIPDGTSPEELMMTGLNTMTIGGDGMGDGYNAWANGGVVPMGAPPANIPPGGSRVSGDVSGASQFMPQTGPIEFVRKDILTGECTKIETREVVPCPDQVGAKPMATPPGKTPTNPKPTPTPKTDPVPTTDKPADATTDKAKPQPSPKTPTRQSKPKSTRPGSGESLD
ncbi:MAG: serine/threonine protein kinase [Pyrinomonadaceae bacterium]